MRNRNHLSAMAAIRSSGLASQGPACLYGGFLQEWMISRGDTGRLSQSLRREQMTVRWGAAVRFRIRNSPSTLRISTHISWRRGDPLSSQLIYLIPRTSILGAILLTGYLGGAVASNVRAGSGWFETIFPMLFAALVWGGMVLRDHRLRVLLLGR
jgi:hypothetical protein